MNRYDNWVTDSPNTDRQESQAALTTLSDLGYSCYRHRWVADGRGGGYCANGCGETVDAWEVGA